MLWTVPSMSVAMQSLFWTIDCFDDFFCVHVCVCSDRQRMLKKWQKQFGKQMQENRNKVQ